MKSSPPSPGKLGQLDFHDSDGQETCLLSILPGARARAVGSRKRHSSAKWLTKNSAFAKAELFLCNASQQPSVARDVDNTFICDANGEV